MREPNLLVNGTIDASRVFQTMDGFGVNINARYWVGDQLLPVMKLLIDDLGASLFRVDIWGKSNWIDPSSQFGRESLSTDNLEKVYTGEIFQRGWKMIRYLNQRGILPYLTASGDVPAWMLAADGKTLDDYESFCEMMVSMLAWAKKREGLDFHLFGPLNETDCGSPEGPRLSPQNFPQVLEILDQKLHQAGLDDIYLVVAEQSSFNADYLRFIIKNPCLVDRLGVFGMHMYADTPTDEISAVVNLVRSSRYAKCKFWLTEYGDLEQSGEREWYVAWVMTKRLFNALEAGFEGALAWDAFDNYHDHDEAWTIYGLIRTGLRTFTPKKRFFASKQVYRFVRQGFQRIETWVDSPGIRLLAFTDKSRHRFTIVGMNAGESCYLNIHLRDFPEELMHGKACLYQTDTYNNCALIGEIPIRAGNYPFYGLVAEVPANTIFTITTE